MKKKLSLMLCLVIMTLTMAACGTDPASVDYFGMGYDDLKNGMEQDVASLVNMTDENRESINAYGSDEVIKLLTTWMIQLQTLALIRVLENSPLIRRRTL